MSTVFIVRHARHSVVDHVLVGRMANVALSDEGRREAAELATGFRGRPIAMVQSSPSQRARETAAPIAAALGADVEIVPALDEIDFGRWTGSSFEALAPDPNWQAWNAARGSARPPEGESITEAQARVVGHIDRLGHSPDVGPAVLVSHCEVIRAALLHVLGRPVDDWSNIEVAPASVSTIEVEDGRARVTAINERRPS